MLKQWLVVGNSVFDLTAPRLEPQTSRSMDKRVTAQPTGWFGQMTEFRRGLKPIVKMRKCLIWMMCLSEEVICN